MVARDGAGVRHVGVATLCGPAIGGIFAQTGHWRLAFWTLLPAGALLAFIVATKVGGKSTVSDARPSPVPLATLGLLVASVLAITLASLSQDLRWNLAGIVAGLAIALLIARVDTRAGKKLLPSGAYTLATPLGSLYAIICLVVAAITTEIFVPYFLQTIHGFSPLAAGYMTAAMAAAGRWRPCPAPRAAARRPTA